MLIFTHCFVVSQVALILKFFLNNQINSLLLLCIYNRLNMSECFTLGDVTTVNMTMVKGGVAYNVIPAEMDVSFDLRIPPTVNLQVCKNAYL